MSSGLRSDFLLVLTGQVGSGEGFLSGESMLPAEAVVRAHCARTPAGQAGDGPTLGTEEPAGG